MSPKSADELAALLLCYLRTRMGGLHIAHARRVAAAVRRTGNDGTFAAALLHDVVEKGRINLDDLRTLTTDQRLVALVGPDPPPRRQRPGVPDTVRG